MDSRTKPDGCRWITDSTFGLSRRPPPFGLVFSCFSFTERFSPPLCRVSLIDPTGLYGPTRCDEHFIMGPVNWPLQDRSVTKSWTERPLDQPLHDGRGTIGCSKMHLVRWGWAPCHIPAATPVRHAISSRQTHTPNPNCSRSRTVRGERYRLLLPSDLDRVRCGKEQQPCAVVALEHCRGSQEANKSTVHTIVCG